MNSTVVIAIGIVLIIALIVWAFTMSTRKEAAKKQKMIMGRLEALAKEHDSTIGPTDNMGTKTIAMDNSKGKIFYVDHSSEVAQAEVIDITDVANCEMVQTGSRQIGETKSGRRTIEDHINRIQLEVSKKNGEKVALLFYDERNDGILEMLMLKEKAEKWKGVIKN